MEVTGINSVDKTVCIRMEGGKSTIFVSEIVTMILFSQLNIHDFPRTKCHAFVSPY